MLPAYLTEDVLVSIIECALKEDVGPGDVTTLATVSAETKTEAQFYAKAKGIIAGLQVADYVFNTVDPGLRVEWTIQDGEAVHSTTTFGSVYGSARSILTAERTVLNLMQRMSGIATATRAMVDATKPHRARILDTRKTAPGLRPLDKWAVKLGGGENHRIGLFDMILIKDNHIHAAGGIKPAIQAARRYLASTNQQLEIEIETRTLEEVKSVLEMGRVDYLMLDNMVQLSSGGTVDTILLKEAVSLIKGRFQTEVSGNVTLETVPAIAATGVDYISCGALTHSVTALDISLKMDIS